MKLPEIIVNVKAYEEATGNKCLKLAEIVGDLNNEYSIQIGLAVQPVDLRYLTNQISNVPIFAQHIDYHHKGANTGRVTAFAVKSTGAVGTLINHSERSRNEIQIKKIVESCNEYGLASIICSPDVQTSEKLAALNPTAIAMEPPELIGGDVSVTTRPSLIVNTIKAIKTVNPSIKTYVGAGIKNGEHVRVSKELGATGILLASGVVKSKEPRKTLIDLLQGFNENS